MKVKDPLLSARRKARSSTSKVCAEVDAEGGNHRRRRHSRCRRDVPIPAFRGPNCSCAFFREDVLVCPCGGRRVVVAFITEKKVVTESLEHLGLRPPVHRSRRRALSHRTRTRPGRITYPQFSTACSERAGRVRTYALDSPCEGGSGRSTVRARADGARPAQAAACPLDVRRKDTCVAFTRRPARGERAARRGG